MSANKKPFIPPADDQKTVKAIRETVEVLTGRRGPKIEPLPATATLADVIAKQNEIIALLMD